MQGLHPLRSPFTEPSRQWNSAYGFEPSWFPSCWVQFLHYLDVVKYLCQYQINTNTNFQLWCYHISSQCPMNYTKHMFEHWPEYLSYHIMSRRMKTMSQSCHALVSDKRNTLNISRVLFVLLNYVTQAKLWLF